MLRDVALVGGALYQRASILEWKVRLPNFEPCLWAIFFFFFRYDDLSSKLTKLLVGNFDVFSQWKSWSDFVNLDGTCSQKVEPLFLSKVIFKILSLHQ